MSETAVVTLLFTDLVGSTELSQRLGEEGAEVLRREHTQALRDAISATGGSEVKHMGDGLMVVFASPSEAAGCAVAMQQTVERHNRKLPEPLGLRIGLHVGEVTKDGTDYFGTAVVVAERLCKRADGGQIFTTDILRALVGSRGGHTFKELGPLELKGMDAPVAACELHWEPDVAEQIPFPAGFPRVDRTLFVGRNEERERLAAMCRRAVAGERQLALISGEPGIGKTRLATELALDAHNGAAIVLFGRCDEDLGVPYQPFAEAVRHYVAHCALDELRDHVVEHAGELGRVAPELCKRLPEAPRPEGSEVVDLASDRDVERLRLFDAVCGLLEQAARRAPVVLVLDDLHWATSPTLLLLRHFLRRPNPSRVLVVGTYRDTDLSRTHPFAETLADLRREMEVERISLGGLDEHAITSLLQAVSGQDVGGELLALVRGVHAETEGNPFFVGQVLRHLVETRALYEKDGRWTYDGSVDKLGIPEGVREVIGRRMSRLSEAANRALGVAAVVGVDFDLSLLEHVLDESGPDDVLDAVDEAVRSRIVDEVPASPGHYRFTHTLVRQTLYEELSSARRVRVHERVGRGIEALHAADLAPHLSRLARHFAEAARTGHVDKAADYGLRAAQDALLRSAYEEAIGSAHRALQVLDLDDGPRHEERASLLLVVAEARAYLGESGGVQEAAGAAADHARKAGSPVLLAEAAQWFCAMFVGNAEKAYELCTEALASLPDEEMTHRAILTAWLPVVTAAAGKGPRDPRLAEEAVELAKASGDLFVTTMTAWLRLSFHRWAVGENALTTQRFSDLVDDLVRLAETSGAALARFNAMRVRAGFRLASGDRRAYESDYVEMSRLADEMRSPAFELFARGREHIVAVLEGRFDDAEEILSRYREVAGNEMFWLVAHAVRRSWTRGEMGRTGGAGLAAQVELFPRVSSWRAALAAALVARGEREGAREQLEILAADDFAVMRSDQEGGAAFANAAYVCAALPDGGRAERLYRLGTPLAGRLVVVGDAWAVLGAADRFLGILAMTSGRLDDAERHLRAGLALEEGADAPTLVARSRYWLARMLLQRTKPEGVPEATELLEKSVEFASRVGMKLLERDAQALLAEI